MKPIFLLAGRRPDPLDANTARFPIENALAVSERIRSLMVEREPDALICSAACGADLLALDVAGELDIPRHVVLPFEASYFRKSSVTDRPGDWGPLFDRILRDTEASGSLVVLDEPPTNDDAYSRANYHMLQLALERENPIIAVAVWEGGSRGKGDLTAELLESASKAGASTEEVLTL